MPFFMRTRRLDIKRLERKPQESLSVVHTVLGNGVRGVIAKLGRVERSFYGTDVDDHAKVVRAWSVCVKSIISDVHLAKLTSSRQIDEIIKRTSELPNVFKVDVYYLNQLKEVYAKYKNAMPHMFADILLDAKTILKYMEKYCLSFYDTESSIVYDTAEHYEKERGNFADTIRQNISNVTCMPHKFQFESLQVSDLTTAGHEFARKADCLSAPFLAMFHEACTNIRTACEAFHRWLSIDAKYASFVHKDIQEYREKKASQLRSLQLHKDKFHQVYFNVKISRREMEQLQAEVDDLRERDNDLIVQEELLADEINSIRLELESKEHRRDELVRNATRYEPRFLYEIYGQLSEDIRDRKARLPCATRQLGNARHKRSWIATKKAELHEVKQNYARMTKQLIEADRLKDASARQYQETTRLLQIANQIYLYKSSSDTIAKIFNNQVVGLNYTRLPSDNSTQDPFDSACAVVANNIENDWPRLYRFLPFYPPRGTNTIDEDVRQFSARSARYTLVDLVICCLRKWRRHHTRAKLDDLKDTLANMKRLDILQLLEEHLQPTRPIIKPEAEREDEQHETDADAQLRYLLRQVERFDQLRAANKI